MSSPVTAGVGVGATATQPTDDGQSKRRSDRSGRTDHRAALEPGAGCPQNPRAVSPHTPGIHWPKSKRSGWASGARRSVSSGRTLPALGSPLALPRISVLSPAGLGGPAASPGCGADPETTWGLPIHAVGSKTKLPSSYALDNKAKGSLSQTRDLHFRRSPCLKKGADVSDGGVRSSASGWAAATESPRAPQITRCARALCRPPTVPSVALVMLNAPLPKITRILRG